MSRQIDTLRLAAIRARRSVLDDTQKRIADELMSGTMGLGQIGLAM